MEHITQMKSMENGTVETSENVCKEKSPETSEEKIENQKEDSRHYFSISFSKSLKVRICKPLILMKLALFLWYGVGTIPHMFLILFLKKKGLTLSELSIIYTVSPVLQVLGPTISGIITDKIRRSKIVLIINLLLTAAIVIGLLLCPTMLSSNCNLQHPEIKHSTVDTYTTGLNSTNSNVTGEVLHFGSCNRSCPDENSNLSWDMFKIYSQNCIYYVNENEISTVCNLSNLIYLVNSTNTWCDIFLNTSCPADCCLHPDEKCSEINNSPRGFLILYAVLVAFFFMTCTNVYRIMDVTTMFQMELYNSDFGFHRVFSVLGIVLLSPLSGYIVDATSFDGEGKNYESVVYFFVGMIFLQCIVVYQLKVQIQPPADNMWKKSVSLLKNPEIIVLIFLVVILGTAFNFNKLFVNVFLETMNPPNFLMGLLSSLNSLYGLPFLITSGFWMKKLGSSNIFLLALLGYFISGIGYSFLYNPWLSLLIEISNVFTYHLCWVSVIEYSYAIAPEGLTATVIATVGGAHFAIGRATSSVVGGLVMDKYGGRIAYRVIGLMCLTTAFLYVIYLCIRKRFIMKMDKRTTSINKA